ncbi:hypothetical protein D3C75_1159510 [compost metagenome]
MLGTVNVAQDHGIALGKQRSLKEIKKQYGDIDHFICICLEYDLGQYQRACEHQQDNPPDILIPISPNAPEGIGNYGDKRPNRH